MGIRDGQLSFETAVSAKQSSPPHW